MHSVHVDLGPRSYDIQIRSGSLQQCGVWLGPFGTSRLACVVADANVQSHHHVEGLQNVLEAEGFRVAVHILPAGEEQKCLRSLQQLYDWLAGLRADRQTMVVALGGGVIGDLAGFAAATYHRGLSLVMVPTSLLAMVDSSVGGKVGINLPQGKNLVGAFHQPVGVWIDTAYLHTLPSREFRSGLAEVVKYGVIVDVGLFAWLETHAGEILRRDSQALEYLIARSCEIKAQIVQQDELETTGLRAILNYGHTFGHALEAVAGYGTLLHGEAVAMGMMCAARLAESLGRIPREFTKRQERLLRQFGLPVEPQLEGSVDVIVETMLRDKKNQSGELRLVLPADLGKVESGIRVEVSQVRKVLASVIPGEAT
jgi:3-dehydroquinate synthase